MALISRSPASREPKGPHMVSNLLNAGQDVLLYALTLIAALAILFSQLDESVTVARQKPEDSGKRNSLNATGEVPLHDSVPRAC